MSAHSLKTGNSNVKKERVIMKTERFRGVFPYLVTPLDNKQNVNSAVVFKLCDDLIAAGVHGLAALGSTGEFAYLTASQKIAMVESVVAATKRRVPVLAGVSATTIADAVRQAKACEKAGVDGLVVAIDAYFPINHRGVVDYFTSVAKAVELPIVIYTNPNYQKATLSIEVLNELSDLENIVALKDASSNTGRLLSLLNRIEGRLDIFSASSHIPAAVMMMGGKGWMAGPACVAPKQSIELYDACISGRWSEAVALQRRLWSLNEAFEKYNLAACMKAALEFKGYEVGTAIAPQQQLNEIELEDLKSVVEHCE